MGRSSLPDPITARESLARHRGPVVASFVAVSAVVAAAAGVPERPYLIIWIGVLAVLVTWGNPATWARVTFDWLPILIIAAGYDLVRSFAADLIPRATTKPQLRFDELLFGGVAPTVRLQHALVDRGTPHWWDYGVWAFYLSHFVATPAVALWCYLRHRDWFRRYRVLIPVVSIAGFVTYFVIPAVPPWMASRNGELPHTVRIVYLVWNQLGVTSAAKIFSGNAKLANPVGALPSLHAAWPFVALLFFWDWAPRGRTLLIAYNAIMVVVLIYGAEHYVSDILLGWTYAAVVYVLVDRAFTRRDRRDPNRDEPTDQRSASASIRS
jgi:hypothetical protein